MGALGRKVIPFSTAAGTVTLLQAAVNNKQVRVVGLGLTVDVAGTLELRNEDNSNPLPLQFAANGGFAYAGDDDAPAYETDLSKGLEIAPNAGQIVKGFVTIHFV